MSRLTLVVPCYNEERRLDVEAFRQLSVPGHDVDFLFVNDGSRDGTLRLLQTLRDTDPRRFAVLDLEKNSGKAEAVRRGFLAAMEKGPDYAGFWDADLATPLAELPGFLDILTSRPSIHLVMGARVRLLGREISRRPARHYFGRVGATLISSSLGLAVYDTQCGAKIFRNSDTLRDVFSKPFISRWIFDVEIIARYIVRWGRDAVATSVYELPVMRWHDVTGSNVKSHDFLRALADLWKIRRAYRKQEPERH
ncbi:MAG TPA: glycosyltransferase [Thermoanaerobaculia bacterium]|nr:glycosyltransferase [Thermoanaerobaculia bacterium]